MKIGYAQIVKMLKALEPLTFDELQILAPSAAKAAAVDPWPFETFYGASHSGEIYRYAAWGHTVAIWNTAAGCWKPVTVIMYDENADGYRI